MRVNCSPTTSAVAATSSGATAAAAASLPPLPPLRRFRRHGRKGKAGEAGAAAQQLGVGRQRQGNTRVQLGSGSGGIGQRRRLLGDGHVEDEAQSALADGRPEACVEKGRHAAGLVGEVANVGNDIKVNGRGALAARAPEGGKGVEEGVSGGVVYLAALADEAQDAVQQREIVVQRRLLPAGGVVQVPRAAHLVGVVVAW